jgi:hypothetical protein
MEPLAEISAKQCRQYASKYTPAMLTELLRDFYVKQQRLPTVSDFNRGLIPAADIYRRTFGSVEAAYREAGIAKVIDINPIQRLGQQIAKELRRERTAQLQRVSQTSP